MSDEKRRLAEHLARLDPARLAPQDARHVRLVFDDTVACMIGGLREPAVARLRALLQEGRTIEPLTAVRGGSQVIAFLLGTAGAALELDEGNYAAGGHPAVPAAAAALAEAAALGASRADRLAAFLAGYEAGARIGYAADLRPGLHRHSAWGTIGAAVAAARVRRFPVDRMAAAIDLAATLCIASSSVAARRGADVRNAAIGSAARQGVLACDLIEAGFAGQADGCDWMFGKALGDRLDPRRLVDGLPSRLLVRENFLKVHACCRETQGAIAAYDAARGAAAIAAAAVARIDVETFAEAAALGQPRPANAMAARFSIPAVLAAYILTGDVGLDAFEGGRLGDPRLRALIDTVSVAEDPALTGLFPKERIFRCRIHLGDGRILAGRIDQAAESVGDPVLRDRLARKIRRLRG